MTNAGLHWRAMAARDLPAVNRVADAVHPLYPEDDAVFAERLALYPAGCLVLEGNAGVQGYAVAHPWILGRPPALNTLLGHLPEEADTFYIHDVAVLPAARGARHAAAGVALLLETAARDGFGNVSLVAIRGAAGFWEKLGFSVEDAPALHDKLAAYDDAARLMVRRSTRGEVSSPRSDLA